MRSMLIADFWKKREAASFKRRYFLTVLFAIGFLILGNSLVDSTLDKLILANIRIAALSFSLLAGFYWKKASTFGALLSMIVGLSWETGCYLYFGEKESTHGIGLCMACHLYLSAVLLDLC